MRYFLFIFLLLPLHFFGQPTNPESGKVFTDTIVPRVDIIINPDTLDWLYDNVESFREFHATFIFSANQQTDTIYNIGFRLRGNTSRYSAKKSFKVSFNTFEHGRKWHGLEKLNLNGEHNDPSIIRAKLCWDMLRDFEVPAARANHVELYINNNFYGLYLNVEHIDEVFMKSRFGNDNGNLYKCLYPADLDYLGILPDNYKLTMGDRRVYDLKTNTAADDYSDLAHFIDVLNNTPDEDFACEIEKVFNIQDYLKIIAVDVFTGNWDGYIYNKNNFYLYHNLQSGKIEYINYDLDNTFGIDWMNIDWALRNIYDWQQHGGQHRLLYTRVMNNQELRDQFSYYMNELLTQIVGQDSYINRIIYFRDRNAAYVANDPYYPLDYGFTPDDFIASYTEALGDHVKYGIIPYINTRRLSASGQLEGNNMHPVIKNIENNFVQVGVDLWVKATILTNASISDVQLSYSLNGGVPLQSEMFDDGNHHDGAANDHIFGGSLENISSNTTLLYQVEATDIIGNSALKPCDAIEIIVEESTQAALFINEFMASNDSTIADEAGEYDDWIEIYNGDTESIALGDKYLSDNLNIPNKWQMPDVNLDPGAFILIWADNDLEQGPNHTNFKLNAGGEEIGIFDAESTGHVVLDSITYGPQNSDISQGLDVDGGENYTLFTTPTPGYSNITGGVNDVDIQNKQVLFYPNPATEGYLYLINPGTAQIYSGCGQLLQSFSYSNKLDIRSFRPGIYFLIINQKQASKFIIQ